MNRFAVTHTNPSLFAVAHSNPRLFAVTHTNPSLFAVAHSNPRLFAVTHTNPSLFAVAHIPLFVNLKVDSVITDNPLYAPGGSIVCTVGLSNLGAAGSQTIEWELIDNSDIILSSGSQASDTVAKRASGNTILAGIVAPDVYAEFRIRARIAGDSDWIYSSVKYYLPVDLTVTACIRDVEYYAPDASIPINVTVVNEGFAGSETIEWELWSSGLGTIQSGTQSSGTVGDFAMAVVALTGIVSPSGGEYLFFARARVQGASTWQTSQFLTNYIPSIPPNPTPRG